MTRLAASTDAAPAAFKGNLETEVHTDAESDDRNPKPRILQLLRLRLLLLHGLGLLVVGSVVAIHAWVVDERLGSLHEHRSHHKFRRRKASASALLLHL